jgi:hypothetical protein
MRNTLFVYPLSEGGTRLRDEKNKSESLFQFRPVSQFRQDLEKTSPVTRKCSVVAVSHRFTLERTQRKSFLLLADLLTRLPYSRFTSKLVDRAIAIAEEGGEA